MPSLVKGTRVESGPSKGTDMRTNEDAGQAAGVQGRPGMGTMGKENAATYKRTKVDYATRTETGGAGDTRGAKVPKGSKSGKY